MVLNLSYSLVPPGKFKSLIPGYHTQRLKNKISQWFWHPSQGEDSLLQRADLSCAHRIYDLGRPSTKKRLEKFSISYFDNQRPIQNPYFSLLPTPIPYPPVTYTSCCCKEPAVKGLSHWMDKNYGSNRNVRYQKAPPLVKRCKEKQILLANSVNDTRFPVNCAYSWFSVER